MDFDKYQFEHDGLYYKHKLSINLPSSTYAKHTHNMYELLYFVSGNITQVIEDRRYKLKSGDLVLIPPQKYHFVEINAPSNYERYNILFDAQMLNIDSISHFDKGVFVFNLNDVPIAKEILQKTDYYFQNLESDDFASIMTHLLSELFCVLRLSSYKRDTNPFAVMNPTLSEALYYINENLAVLSDMDEVAKECFVSKSYLFRLFKHELHQTPKKYITEKRLLMAHSKIVDGERPTEVYAACGYGDYTAFYRNYIRFFGYSPSKTMIKINNNRMNRTCKKS